MPREVELVQRGIVFHNARQFVEAERCYQTVLRDNPKNTDALNLMGVLAVEANQNHLALDYFRKAVRLNPAIAMYRNNLGNALVVNSDLEEALPHLEAAARLDPRYIDALCNLGKVYRLQGAMQKAADYFNQALAIDGKSLRGQAGLAEIDSEMGRFDQAVASFEKILAQDPENVEAYCGLALAAKFEAEDPRIAGFERLLVSPKLRDDQRAPLHHAFAKICNDIGRYDEAFAHFAFGKKYKNAQFDAAHLERGYEVSCGLFTQEFYAERQGYGVADERPVFIVGLPRSGTTLTEQIVSSHHQVCGLGELPDMRKLVQSLGYGKGKPEDFAATVAALGKRQVEKLAQSYLKSYQHATKPKALRMVDKSPHNYEVLGLIALLFPNAHVLHCRRDLMDNCVAIYMQNFNDSHGYNRSLPDLGRYAKAYRSLMDYSTAALPLKLLAVDYEKNVEMPEAMARAMIAHLGLDWDDACLRFFENERVVRTPSRWQVRQPIYASSVNRWKRYEKHLGPLKVALGN